MNELKIIDERIVLEKEFKIYGTKDNPLFLAKDVANWIGHKKPNEMISNVDELEKTKIKINHSDSIAMVLQPNTEYWFLTEDGLYEVLMLSRKQIAKQFKKKVKEILKDIRKNGMYAVDELLDNPDLLIATATRLKEERELRLKVEAEVKQLAATVEHKKDIIEGLLDEIPVAEKRQRINQIVRGSKGCNYQERWSLLYGEFDKIHHIDTNRRLINSKNKGQVKQSLSRVGYICDVMGMTSELYSTACKLFEGDALKLMKEMWSTLN